MKSAKHQLTRVVKNTKLTILELITLLCQIKACVNSRPMTPLSSDPSAMEPLTPAHFLISGSDVSAKTARLASQVNSQMV